MKNISIHFVVFILLLSGLNIHLPLIPMDCDLNDDLDIYPNLVFGNMDMDASVFHDSGMQNGKEHYFLYHFLEIILAIYNKDDHSFLIEKQLDLIESNYPIFFEELKGLSQTTGISIERLIRMSLVISSILGDQCTVTISTTPATRDNKTFLTQNFDSPTTSLIKHIIRIFFTRTYHINKNYYNYIFLGIPVLYEIPLINEKGLGFGGNGITLTEDPGRIIDEGEGIPIYFLERLTMMSCSTVYEVKQFWMKTNRSSNPDKCWPNHWDYASTAWVDREGGALLIEQTTNYFIAVFANSTDMTNTSEGILWQTNHHQWLDPLLTGSLYPEESVSSKKRGERAKELLENSYGEITLGTCMDITRDHGRGKNSNDICRHPDKNDSRVTVFSWIIDPIEYTVYWTRGQPCSSDFFGRYTKENFSDIFGN